MLRYQTFKTITIGAVLGSLTFAMASCGTKQAQESDTSVLSDSLIKTLILDTVQMEPLVDALNLTGNVDFDQDKVVHVFPLVSGNLQGVTVKLGDYVQQGQILGTIKSTEVAGMTNDLVAAEQNLRLTAKNLKVAQDMYKGGLTSISDYTQAQTSYAQAQAAVTHIREVMQINGTGGGATSVVRAPISGFIVEKFVSNNMIIRPDNSNPLFTISDLKNVWVMANAYESNIGKIHIGAKAEITTLSYQGKIFYGQVNEMLNVLDSTSKVMKVKIQLPNPGYQLKPGMFTGVRIIQNEKGQALAISSHALVFDNSQYYVLVYRGGKNINIVPVQVISTVGDTVYIAAGVQAGDVVIVKNALLIYQELNG